MENNYSIIGKNGKHRLRRKCLHILCETLARSGREFSFCLELGDGFLISLEASYLTTHRAKRRRSPSYFQRQERRRATLLDKKGKLVVDPQGIAEGAMETLQDKEGSGGDGETTEQSL